LDLTRGKTPFFFDGAFGTYYHSKFHKNIFCETANLSDTAGEKHRGGLGGPDAAARR